MIYASKHNVKKRSNILQNSCGANLAIFLKYAWPFFNITYERVKQKLYNKETYLESGQTHMIKFSAKIVNRWKPLTIFTKKFHLDISQDSRYTSATFYKNRSYNYFVTLMLLIFIMTVTYIKILLFSKSIFKLWVKNTINLLNALS